MGSDGVNWKTLAPGLELGVFRAAMSSQIGDSRITIVRIDPNLWDLLLLGPTATDGPAGMTARAWSQQHDLAAVINAGMFATDALTHVGYLQSRGHMRNPTINDYGSVAAFDPRTDQKPRFRIFDLDAPGVSLPAILQDYASAVQNLRLIKRPARNRWPQGERKWSEAALAEDQAGRILFVFSRSPFTMHDFVQELQSLGIGVVCAQHLEGGPEAQLYIHVPGLERELFGSYETSFREDDTNEKPWPIPNVLGIRQRRTGMH